MAWLLGDSTVGIVTWIGTVAGLLGLSATYLEARKARRAATAAAEAVRLLEARLALADLAFLNAQVDTLRVLVQSGNTLAAQGLFGPFRRMASQTEHLFTSPAAPEGVSNVVRKSLRTVETQLRYAAAEPEKYKSSALMKALAGLAEFLTDRENAVKFPRER